MGSSPQRSWSSCNQPLCTPEKPYQRSLTRHTPCSSGGTTPSPSSGECAVVNGTCTFTEDAPNCTSWLSPCERQYRCTTVEEYMSETSTMPNCSLSTQVPSPDSLCVAINGSCQWYNPCRTWQGHCWSGYQCGSESDYWTFYFGPQPLCLPRPFGFQTPPPAGKCIIQNGQCSWSSESVELLCIQAFFTSRYTVVIVFLKTGQDLASVCFSDLLATHLTLSPQPAGHGWTGARLIGCVEPTMSTSTTLRGTLLPAPASLTATLPLLSLDCANSILPLSHVVSILHVSATIM